MSVHPTMAPFLASIAPVGSVYARAGDGLNDDDVYLVDVATKRVLKRWGCKSATADAARFNGIGVRTGQALLTGMQARSFGALA